MENPFRKKRRPWRGRVTFLKIDSWVDTTLYEAGFAAGQFWENITIFFRRFRVRGFWRLVFELLGEATTLGAAGSVLMLALALPAFDDTAKNWRTQNDYAVTFLDRYGNVIGKRGILHNPSVPVDEMPDYVIKAVLGTEDRRFFEHYGIDFIGLIRALETNARANTVVQGGSTITQQLAKNLFLSNERTISRKIKEAFLAVWLEANLTKKQILQLYLDRTYMGGGTFGIAAASEYYFGKDIRDVTLPEAAMLAGLFKAPTKYAPSVNLPAARARANEVLTNMVQAGFMTEGQVVAARRHPASVVDRGTSDTPDYFLDWAFDRVKQIAARFPQRTLVVKTTLDPGIQKATEEAIEFHLRQYGKQYHVSQAAAVVLSNDGSVRAIVGGRDYGESQFNRATQARRQVGSSFKPYVYTVAMQKGLTPKSMTSGAPITWGRWSPHNYSRGEGGPMTLEWALAHSVNTAAVRIAKTVTGTEDVAKLAHEMGVESPLSTYKTMVLGTNGMTVMDQATAYNCFANGGFADTRHGITEIMDGNGHVLWDWKRNGPKPVRVLSPKVDAEMNEMLVQIPESGTGRRAALPMTIAAGKTGTTQDYRDGWFVGFTGNYTAAVWFGNDDYSPTNRVFGGSLPAMTWKRFMTYAHQNIELKRIPYIDKPLPEQPKVASNAAKDDAGDMPPERPKMLSAATKSVLREILEQFNKAKPITVPPAAEKMSALYD